MPPTDRDEFEPIFVVGCPRSGTTLLTIMLDRHPQVAMTPELHLFRDVPLRRRRIEAAGHAAIVAQQFTEDCFTRDLDLDPALVLERFRACEPTYDAFFRCVLELYAELAGKTRVGEKSPDHLWHVPDILRWAPRAKIIWIVRDGRDTVMALMRAPFGHRNLRRHAFTWRRTVDEGLRYERRYPGRILRVSFEDLVLKPRESLERICAYAGIAFDEEQLDTTRRSSGAIPPKDMACRGRALEPLDRAKVGEYASATSEAEKWLLDSVLHRHLRRMGYPPTQVRPCPLPTRLLHAAINFVLSIEYRPDIYHPTRWVYHNTLRQARRLLAPLSPRRRSDVSVPEPAGRATGDGGAPGPRSEPGLALRCLGPGRTQDAPGLASSCEARDDVLS